MEQIGIIVGEDFSTVRGDFRIRISGSFESAHYLYAYYPDGSDEILHGHSWRVEITLSQKDGGIRNDGISIDFLSVRKQFDALLERLDHCCINTLSEFVNVNPTAENIARWFYLGLIENVRLENGAIREISVYEGGENTAIFIPAQAQ